MSTNSTIAVLENGKITAVYCHWDGYIENNGEILQNHYDLAKTKQLLAQGSVSVLGEDIGKKQSFDDYAANTCVFYGRDRGDDDDDTKAKTFKTKKAMIKWFDTPFFYLLDAATGEWSASRGETWFNLKNALER